jgi:GT2 family glycosyltransferase
VRREPAVTVGAVSWNAAADLDALLTALPAAVGDLPAQIVVVDNGSTDDTRRLLMDRPGVEPVFNERNLGLTPGRNQILDRARGRYICMLDADTIPRPRSIETLVSYLEDRPHVGLAAARLLNPDGSLQLSCRTFPPLVLPFLRRPPLNRVLERRRTVNRHLMREYDHRAARAVDWALGACQCYRASLLPVLGRYDERIFSHGGEDTDWCIRVWLAGFEVHYVPAAEIVHAYGHFTRRNPLSRQSRRAIVDYFYMQAKHRRSRRSLAPR